MAYENIDTRATTDSDTTTPTHARAEWDRAELILSHQPGDEVFLGLVHPRIALFESTFSLEDAAAEHDAYRKMLHQHGAEVRTVAGVLLDRANEPGVTRARLIALALSQTELNLDKVPEHLREAERKYFADIMMKADSRVLLRMALQRPVISLKKKDADTPLAAMQRARASYDFASDEVVLDSYQVRPLMNMYFARDHMITTAKGVVLGRMANPQRVNEIDIIRVVLQNLEIKPLLEIGGRDTLEGGDFIPAGEHVFIGTGLRTTPGAVKAMLDADVFGAPTVYVVKDRWRNQQEMHLDTYFNVIDKDLVVLCQQRLSATREDPKYVTVDVWQKVGSTYRQTQTDVPFVNLLRDQLKCQIVVASHRVQELYGINFLTVGTRKLVGVAAPPQGTPGRDEYLAYQRALAEARVAATWTGMESLKLGYGAAHCMTQVLRRSR